MKMKVFGFDCCVVHIVPSSILFNLFNSMRYFYFIFEHYEKLLIDVIVFVFDGTILHLLTIVSCLRGGGSRLAALNSFASEEPLDPVDDQGGVPDPVDLEVEAEHRTQLASHPAGQIVDVQFNRGRHFSNRNVMTELVLIQL